MIRMQFKIEVQDETGVWSDVRGPDGKLLIFDDEGAARAIRTGGRSLLPVGIREVQGAFGREELEIVDGYAFAPQRPGLGAVYDWDAIDDATVEIL